MPNKNRINDESVNTEFEHLQDPDDPRFKIHTHQQIASACTGALVTSLLMTPFDVVKVRLQVQQKELISNKCFLYCNGLMDHLCACGAESESKRTAKPVHFKGTLDAFVKIRQCEGMSALWSGLSPTLILAVPATVIYFVAYEKLREAYEGIYLNYLRQAGAVPLFIPMLAGCTARMIAVTIVSPLELVRTKMQSERLSYYEIKSVLRTTVNTTGVLTLWKGLAPTLLRDVPFSGIYWSCYERIKKRLNDKDLSVFVRSFIAGAISGATAALFTTPFDVVKTHRQIEFGEQVIYTDKPGKTEGTLYHIQKIFKASGIKGLFAGVVPRLARVAPACAIMIATFETGKAFFCHYNYRKYVEKRNSEDF